jgi:putative ABC transport system permease protein
LLNPYIVSQTGVSIGLLDYATFDLHLFGRLVQVPFELLLVPGLLILASVVGYLPAMSAYRTDVAKSLTATP